MNKEMIIIFFIFFSYNLLVIYMKLFRSIRNYIDEDDLKIIVYKNKIDIINYSSIGEVTSNLITFNNNIKIEGKNLKIDKLLDNEVLITGKLNNLSIDE